MKQEENANLENYEKYLSLSINKRKDILEKGNEKKKIPFECTFPNCEKICLVKSKLKLHLRSHVIYFIKIFFCNL